MSDLHPAHMPKIIAHRGASGSAPENTLAAIRRAAELGARAVEFDATVSAEGIALVMHDFNVERCSDGHGPVVLKTLEEVEKLDAGGWFDPRFAGEPIPTLKHALEVVRATDMMLNLEIKPTLGWEEPTARAVAQALRDSWPLERPVLVSSMSPLALDAFRDLMPGVPLGLIVYAVPENWRQRLKDHHCHSLHCYRDFVTYDLVQDVHALDARLHVFTVNALDTAKSLFAMGVDAVFTDHPENLLELS